MLGETTLSINGQKRNAGRKRLPPFQSLRVQWELSRDGNSVLSPKAALRYLCLLQPLLPFLMYVSKNIFPTTHLTSTQQRPITTSLLLLELPQVTAQAVETFRGIIQIAFFISLPFILKIITIMISDNEVYGQFPIWQSIEACYCTADHSTRIACASSQRRGVMSNMQTMHWQ